MTQVLRLLMMLAFVGMGLRLSRLPPGTARRRGETAFIAFALGLSVAVGVLQKDAWPFSPYPILAEDATRAAVLERVVVKGVDANGAEWDVHPWAWSPLPATKIEEWIHTVYPRLEPASRRNAERFLLARAEEARGASRVRREVGRGRWIGPLAAPGWMAERAAPAAGEAPFVALRAYVVKWRPREVLADPGRVERRLLFDTARP
jgi:hypothetical protein